MFMHGHSEIVNSKSGCDFDKKIETVLIEWWLAGTDVFLMFSEFDKWRDSINVNSDSINYDSMNEDIVWEEMCAKKEKIEALTGMEAVRIGMWRWY